MNDQLKIVPTKSDKERAAEIKTLLIETTKPFLEVATQAYSEGLEVQVSFGPNAFGQIVIQHMGILKRL